MKQLRIILQGGGTRCAYQMALLEKLIHNPKFNDNYVIDSVYGTSFGALVGYFLCINKLDVLNDFFLSLNQNSLKPHFDLWGYKKYLKMIPYIGQLFGTIIDGVWLLKSVLEKSLYIQEIDNLFDQYKDLTTDEMIQLNKFNCCVYNITKQKIEYINGSHPFIIDYILASSALWIIFKPKLIRQLKSECVCDVTCVCTKHDEEVFCTCDIKTHQFNEYMDGGLLKPIPYERDDAYFGNYLILTTKDINRISNKKLLFDNSGNNLFEYLDNIITFLTEYIQYTNIQYIDHLWYKNANIHLINYNTKHNNPALLDKKIIYEYMNDGRLLADNFLDTL